MSLPDWERNGWLTAHGTSRNEIRDLLDVVERDLADSAAEGLLVRIVHGLQNRPEPRVCQLSDPSRC